MAGLGMTGHAWSSGTEMQNEFAEEVNMCGMSGWLEEQNLAELSRHAGRSITELRQVLVTQAMTEAALSYVQSLHDPLLSVHLLEETFRIMVVLQPKVLEV